MPRKRKNPFDDLVKDTYQKCQALNRRYLLPENDIPDRIVERLERARTAVSEVDAKYLVKRALDSMEVHVLTRGTTPGQLQKKEKQNLKLADWKERTGHEDEAQKARERAARYAQLATRPPES